MKGAMKGAMNGATDGTDILLRLHEYDSKRYPHLLASTAGKDGQSRFSILFARPGDSLILDHKNHLTLNGQPIDDGDQDFLTTFDRLWRAAATDIDRRNRSSRQSATNGKTRLPFYGGWFLYLGYEVAGQIEPRLRLPPARYRLPAAAATRFPAAVISDNVHRNIHIVSDDHTLYDSIETDLHRLLNIAVRDSHPMPLIRMEEEDETPYLRAVDRCIEYIRAGDIFQANLSRKWQAHIGSCSHADLFRRLAKTNPSPFAALASWGENAIISSSPERLISLRDGILETRPIAGTRPRGVDNLSDMMLSRELLSHPKERAEHIMLIDLERNDISRVSIPGSVKVNELMTIESYAHVHHIVSNVRAHIRNDCTPGQITAAMFPGGTITGCPKIRCMEILAELEKTGRGPYTGALGYVNHDASMDLNILIRTMIREKSDISFRAGGGIVADSKPHRELLETRHKARAMVRALTEE